MVLALISKPIRWIRRLLQRLENEENLTGRAPLEDTKKKNVPKETFEKFSATVRDIMVNINIETAKKTDWQYQQEDKGSD